MGALIGRNGKMKTFIRMLKDESGASAAEYALILAIVGAAIALAAIALGGTIANAMNRASSCIADPSAGTC
jgi:pilus assembly protein Flp/PilA